VRPVNPAVEDAAAPAHVGDVTTIETTTTLTEGDVAFITTKNAAGDERILFATTIEAVLLTDSGNLLIVDGLAFRFDGEQYSATSDRRQVFLHARSTDRVAQLRAQGVENRKARQAAARRLAEIADRISAAGSTVRRARRQSDSVTNSLPQRRHELADAKARMDTAQKRLDNYDNAVRAAHEAVVAAENELTAARAERQ